MTKIDKGGAQPGNQNRTVHGGAAGVKALTYGREFTGLAAQRESEVKAEFETDGRAAIVERSSIRLQTLADIHYDLAIKCYQAGDLARGDAYSKTYAWLQGAALRAWGQQKLEEQKDKHKDALETIERYRGKGGDDDTKHS